MLMQKVRTLLRRFGYFLKKDFFTFNNIILGFALILCASWTVGAITSMTKNWELQKKLQSKQIERERLRLEVETLQLEQKYYESDEYLELMARAKGGKMFEGETMVIMPENSDAAKTKYSLPNPDENQKTDNFSEWLAFLFG